MSSPLAVPFPGPLSCKNKGERERERINKKKGREGRKEERERKKRPDGPFFGLFPSLPFEQQFSKRLPAISTVNGSLTFPRGLFPCPILSISLLSRVAAIRDRKEGRPRAFFHSVVIFSNWKRGEERGTQDRKCGADGPEMAPKTPSGASKDVN